MGNYRIVIKKTAQKDLAKHKKSGDKKSISKVSTIIEELKLHPYTGTGKPEALKYEMSGLWSRRINNKDRLVYEVVENVVTVYVISAMVHN